MPAFIAVLSQGSDFESWKVQIDALLHAKDLDDFQYHHAQAVKFSDNEYDDPKTKEIEVQRENSSVSACMIDPRASDYAVRMQEVMLERRRYDALLSHREARPRKAAQTLLSAVAPSLVRGISNDDIAKLYALWKLLEQQSKPFRFLDLPAEMQNRITTHTLAEAIQDITQPQPGITRVNRQIREQTLPMYYTSTTFHIIPRKRDESLYGNAKTLGNATEMMVSQWMQQSVGDHGTYLRRAVLHLDYNFRAKKAPGSGRSTSTVGTVAKSRQINFGFSEERGLRVVADSSCNAKFKIQNHQISIESQRKMLKLTGDSIALALVSNIELWNEGSLCWK